MNKDYCLDLNFKNIDPSSVGMDSKKLSQLEPLIISQYNNINGIIIARRGNVVFEKYYNGYNANDTFHVASVTKSIISALIGIAIDKGYIKDVEQKVVDFFPEYTCSPADIYKKAVTIRHLLTMTAPYPFKNTTESLERLSKQRDWVKYALNQLGQNKNIGTFKYSSAGVHLLSAIITNTTGKCAREFANEHLFKPIGMREIPDYDIKNFNFEDLFGKNLKGWAKDRQGNTAGGWGLTLSARDMLRFGYLYLNGGIWNNKCIISKSWIEESTKMNSNEYGYLWWLCEEDGALWYSAMGAGGNAICCIPKYDLVIAIPSKIVFKPRDRWQLIKKHILTSIIE
ncbi:serine hydrolase domain-containing protein [Clostridioides difficile]